MHQEDLRFVRRCLEAFSGKESYQWLLAEVEGVDEEEMEAVTDDYDEPSAVPTNGSTAALPTNGSSASAGVQEQQQQQQQPDAASSPKEPEGEQPLPSAAKSLVTCSSTVTCDPACNAAVLPWWLPPERVPPGLTGALLLLLLEYPLA